MNSFSKIINRLSSNEEIYTTKFLNFKYDGVSVFQETKEEKIDTYNRFLKDVIERNKELEEEKDSLNKKALKEILTDRENRRLSDIFRIMIKNTSTIEGLEQKMSEISQNNP